MDHQGSTHIPYLVDLDYIVIVITIYSFFFFFWSLSVLSTYKMKISLQKTFEAIWILLLQHWSLYFQNYGNISLFTPISVCSTSKASSSHLREASMLTFHSNTAVTLPCVPFLPELCQTALLQLTPSSWANEHCLYFLQGWKLNPRLLSGTGKQMITEVQPTVSF